MFDQVSALEKKALEELAAAPVETAWLADFEVRTLGKKGSLTLLLRETGGLAPQDRPAFGARVNAAKAAVLERLETLRRDAAARALASRLDAERLDVTLPGRLPAAGTLHPLARMQWEICEVFQRLGFNVESGPDLEDEFHNFDALNMPADHPARDGMDSYYVSPPAGQDGERRVLRTHTSSVQVRVLRKRKPPLRMLAPGRVYRRDAADATHGAQFHQVEGLAVDAFGKVRFSDLKGTLESFARLMFGRRLGVRLRPSHFGFTEPSMEVDVQCFQCMGKGCGLCKHSGFIEIMGAGMVHPAVFKSCGLDPEAYSGFAFGMGVERIAMLKWGVNDVRLFTENDPRFLAQF
ncbi:MAG TPA: phenylalanine--tRNA ligase subunit alpha [bacterium]|jgi:phenylalanyl-tRNA synthetase alpha chain|nr:phenylalanine--tRNA ligase subunit alpha [bacterium]